MDHPGSKNLKSWKPGQSGNPQGARLHNPIKKLTQSEVDEVMTLVLKHDVQALSDIKSDKSSSVLRVWVASAALKAIQRGDVSTLEILLNRTLGKPKERVEHSGSIGGDEDLKRRVEKMRLELEALNSDKRDSSK